MNDGLLLLVQQGDELLLGPDVAADELVGVVEEADDGGLFGEWRDRQPDRLNCRVGKPESGDSICFDVKLVSDGIALDGAEEICAENDVLDPVVVALDDIRKSNRRFCGDEAWNPDVVPSFGILRDENVADPEPKSGDLFGRCCGPHE